MKIKLNSTVSMDLEKLIESRLLVQANSGGGKSWAIRRIIEQAFGHVQIIILDPEGEFSNLRSKFDFVYVGNGGDASAEPRSAALLARRLLELKASTIIDLYELNPQERKHFVHLFCEAMVNAPKELWHDTLVIIDEAHVFAPEKGESEAMGSVIDLATRGRKRGYCVVLATQRLPKLNKDAAAECNNKLIGRASQDIDRKRASEELGFTTKEQVLSLRDLEPGEFYAFGPAISREVIKITVGDVRVKPPKRGVSRARPPAASAAVKKILSQLADLPQEAQKELETVQTLQRDLRAAKSEISRLQRPHQAVVAPIKQEFIDSAVKVAEMKKDKAFNALKDKVRTILLKSHGQVKEAMDMLNPTPVADVKDIIFDMSPRRSIKPNELAKTAIAGERSENEQKPLSKGARQVLTYLHSRFPDGRTKAQCWVAAGYAPGGGFNNIMYELTGAALVEKDSSGRYVLTGTPTPMQDMLDPSFDPSLDKWNSKLSSGAAKIFRLLRDHPDDQFNKGYIAQETGYALGGGFNNLIYELTGKELAVKVGVEYKINPEILDL